ncbi:MAG: hypothetical protein QOG91_78 [Candidatus Parcubacteria bacterium]|jgi:hypothetical protein|nr:hypothetical protein [Candidatus Parcubacteria bacterium]
MTVNNTHSKKFSSKKIPTQASQATSSADYAVPVRASRLALPIEIEEQDRIAALDEKTEEDPLAPESDLEELGVDDTGIEEEIDPFGDKWEK